MSWADKTIIRAMYIPLMWCRYSQYALLSTSDKDHEANIHLHCSKELLEIIKFTKYKVIRPK